MVCCATCNEPIEGFDLDQETLKMRHPECMEKPKVIKKDLRESQQSDTVSKDELLKAIADVKRRVSTILSEVDKLFALAKKTE